MELPSTGTWKLWEEQVWGDGTRAQFQCVLWRQPSDVPAETLEALGGVWDLILDFTAKRGSHGTDPQKASRAHGPVRAGSSAHISHRCLCLSRAGCHCLPGQPLCVRTVLTERSSSDTEQTDVLGASDHREKFRKETQGLPV